MAMVSPWMDNGTLPHYVDHHPAADRLQLCLDISNGVAYLHQNDTIHEDLKGANVLISNSGIAKLADFGCAEPNPGTLHFTATTSGANYSIRWAAPEILNGEQTRSKEADVYALGMTFLEVITGEVPFSNKNDLGVYLAVAVKQQIPERPPNFPSLTLGEADQLWGIIVRSCAHEPLDRLGSTIVQSYVQSIRWHSTGHLLPNISVTGPDSSSNARPPQRFQDYFTEQLKLQEVSQVDPALDAGPPYFWNGTTRYPHPGACEWAEYYLNGGTDLTGLVYFTGPYGRVLTSIPPQEGFPVTGSDSGIIVEAQPAFSPPYLWNGTANYPSYGACKWANYYLCGGTDPTGLVYFTGRDGHVLTSIPPQ
ncbi:hypothetical protein FRC12_005498 [Ceratobasidium sp. 428]|nr:hypothetical protein FRC12_005498 [Ceratobasidium sp. 428]